MPRAHSTKRCASRDGKRQRPMNCAPPATLAGCGPSSAGASKHATYCKRFSDLSALHQALRVARRQKAKAYELRAARNLGRLWAEQRRRVEARDLLQTVYRSERTPPSAARRATAKGKGL